MGGGKDRDTMELSLKTLIQEHMRRRGAFWANYMWLSLNQEKKSTYLKHE